MVAYCEIGRRPAFCADTATPAFVCRCSTQLTSGRAAWIALWMTKPAGFTGHSLGATFSPRASTFTRLLRGDLLEEHAVRVDEERVVLAGDARRDVGEDEIVPAEEGDEAVAGGEIDAQIAFVHPARIRLHLVARSRQCLASDCASALGWQSHDPVRTRSRRDAPLVREPALRRASSASTPPREVVEQRGTHPRRLHRRARRGRRPSTRASASSSTQKKCITTFGPYSPGQAVAMKRDGHRGHLPRRLGDERQGLRARGSGAGPRELPAQPGARRGRAHRPRAAHGGQEPVPRPRPHDGGAARGHARGRLPPLHHRRRRHRPRRRRSRPQPHPPLRRGRACPATTSRTRSRASRSAGTRAARCSSREDEQIKRLSAARFQLDIMGVPGIIVARTDAESATLLDGRSDERDQPFILGATNLDLPDASRPRSSPSCGASTPRASRS